MSMSKHVIAVFFFCPLQVVYCVNSGIYLRAVDIHPSAPFISRILRPPSSHSSLLCFPFHSVTAVPIKERAPDAAPVPAAVTPVNPVYLVASERLLQTFNPARLPLILARHKQRKTFLFYFILHTTSVQGQSMHV